MNRWLSGPGFTLIELLVVLGIIGTLLTLVLPVVGIARRAAMRANTENLMHKVEVAISGFRNDVGHFPWYARPAGDTSSRAMPWGNELAYRLHHEMSDAERFALAVDRQAAQAAFAAGGSQDWTDSTRSSQIDQTGGNWSGTDGQRNQRSCAIILNRLSVERAIVGIMSGNTAIAGVARTGSGWGPGSPVVNGPVSRGFCADYLGSDLRSEDCTYTGSGASATPAAIIDLYKTPLVYVHGLANGVTGNFPLPLYIGNGPRLSAVHFALSPQSRGITASLASDVRDTASRAYLSSYELWSCGPDGALQARRNEAPNRDNIPAAGYLKGLAP